MLVVDDLHVVYGRSISALRGVSLSVGEKSILAVLGPNGVGKSTMLKAISCVLKGEQGAITTGGITLDGVAIHRKSPGQIVELGIVQVPEGRRLFTDLTVEQNLLVGGCRRPRREIAETMEQVYAWFPRVADKRRMQSGVLSGGEQQMVVIGRALMAKPRLLLLDEPSLGLAPQVVEQIFATLRQLRDAAGMSILLVEQNAAIALSIADRGTVIESGRAVLNDSSEALAANDIIRQSYLGVSSSGERVRFRRTPAAMLDA